MQKGSLFFLLFIAVLMSCGNNSSKEDKPVEKTVAAPPIYKMDMLERMFSNDNWMQTGGNDTSYYYFSRIPSEIQIHQFRIIKGDSVIIKLSAIHFSGDSLKWRYNDSTYLFLSGITNESSEWKRVNDESPGSFYFAFEKKDHKHINLVDAERKKVVLTKTLPLSTFLIRSHYDYLHGTNYAFSDTLFSAGNKK